MRFVIALFPYRLGAFLALLALFSVWGGVAQAQGRSGAGARPRLALVLTNDAYGALGPLGGTRADGERVARALGQSGFVDASGAGPVTPRVNLTLEQTLAAIEAFRARLAEAGPKAFGMLYFSGHGAALTSYGDVVLLPVDAGARLQARQRELSRSRITKRLLSSGAGTVLLVLDMCRSVVEVPPEEAAPEKAPEGAHADGAVAGKGLSRQVLGEARADQGYLVAYATSPDQVAFDNGQFSRILAEEIRRPQQTIVEAIKRTSDRVAVASAAGKAGWQKPTFDYALRGDAICFVSCDAQAAGRIYDCANCPAMRVVPGGVAVIGSPAGEPGRGRDEPLQHDGPALPSFAVGLYEVTYSEWMACVQAGACKAVPDWTRENPNPLLPVTGVTYEAASGYVAWLRAESHKDYRLPSEVEWEYAARAGSASAFSWGDEIGPGMANYDYTASYHGSPKGAYRGYPEAVNAYPPNDFGLYQMSGNVWEWTADCMDAACAQRVVRGGSFDSAPSALRVANRFAVPGKGHRDDLGLRVVRALEVDELMP
jgi:formylglycine-generating enzyme required for sulfatase activity